MLVGVNKSSFLLNISLWTSFGETSSKLFEENLIYCPGWIFCKEKSNGKKQKKGKEKRQVCDLIKGLKKGGFEKKKKERKKERMKERKSTTKYKNR